MAKRQDGGLFLPGHDGRPKGSPDVPGMHGPARDSDAFKGRAVPGNIARDGAPKAHHDVPVHGSMTRQQVAMAGVGGMGHGVGVDANPGTNPLGGAPRGKTFAPAQPVPGQRSRIMNDDLHGGIPGVNHARAASRNGNLDHDLGRAILDEAFAASSPDDRRAHGRE